jgi:hypothetical protein
MLWRMLIHRICYNRMVSAEDPNQIPSTSLPPWEDLLVVPAAIVTTMTSIRMDVSYCCNAHNKVLRWMTTIRYGIRSDRQIHVQCVHKTNRLDSAGSDVVPVLEMMIASIVVVVLVRPSIDPSWHGDDCW